MVTTAALSTKLVPICSEATSGYGTFLYIGHKWTPRTHVGRIAERAVHGRLNAFALYMADGTKVGHFESLRAAKACLRTILATSTKG
jgi:hypothetical protein